ncbi:hypothetical protein MTO96_038559 [Rhipicephalus appendiculatus]
MNLVLSDKSDLLVYQPIRAWRQPKGWVPTTDIDIHLFTKNGAEILCKGTIRVLGMFISENGRNAATIQKMQQHTAATVQLKGSQVDEEVSRRTTSSGSFMPSI